MVVHSADSVHGVSKGINQRITLSNHGDQTDHLIFWSMLVSRLDCVHNQHEDLAWNVPLTTCYSQHIQYTYPVCGGQRDSSVFYPGHLVSLQNIWHSMTLVHYMPVTL